jgi:hypothetical protein
MLSTASVVLWSELLATDPEVRKVWNGDHLSPVSTIEELLERKSSGSGQENREYGRMVPSR